MRKYNINELQGGEILAQDILSGGYRVLLAAGSVVQKEYVEKFKELGITHVFIKEQDEEKDNALYGKTDVEKKEVREELQKKVNTQVKSVLEKLIYQKNEELQKLTEAATEIIDNILNEEGVSDRMIEIKERSADLYEHSVNCCAISTILGLRLGYTQALLHEIGVGCLMHDIGLRFISVDYINCDIEEMPEAQKKEYKKHTIYGYSSIEKEPWLSEISKNIILSHHEKVDGSGYPFKVRNIAEAVALVGVCDTFDEMICGIGYKKEKVYQAIEYLKTFKKTKFNDRIVDEFLTIIAIFPVGIKVSLNNGELGEIIGQNKGFPERPVVRIIKKTENQTIATEKVYDLLKENTIFIEDILNEGEETY